MGNDKNSGGGSRIASLLANVGAGAATGGVYGAAAGAVKTFLPEIIKTAVIIVVAILLLPTLIFAALPNILFGFSSSIVDDVKRLTDKAFSIDAAYREVQNYSQAEIDRIIEEIKASHMNEDGEADYDEVEVDTDMDNTNMYWFIAITSVAHQQDLFSMSEESIKDMVIRKIVSSSAILSRIVGEGDSATTIRTLKIDIEDLDPDKLMDKLGFDDDERNWARLLYSTLSEEQLSEADDRDGGGGGSYVNYGNITFSDTSTTVVYYHQFDARWADLPYGRTGTISRSACGPSALAIVVSSLTSQRVTPPEVASWAAANGYYSEGNGSYRSLIPDGGAHYGLTVEGIGHDAERLVDALNKGKLVIAIMGPGHFTRKGHFIVLRGITSDGKVLVADSGSLARSNEQWDLRLILNEAGRSTDSGGPFWVVSP